MAAAAAAVLERLGALSCPSLAPLPPLGPPEALELLCRPSRARLELLEWLGGRVHPPFAARLEQLREGPQDARVRELAKLGAKLMLCREDDLALLEGTAPPEQQLEFIWDLLDAAPPPTEEEAGGSSQARFLVELLETPEGVSALRRPKLPPLPLQGLESPPKNRVPLWDLEEALRGSRDHLEQLREQLAALGGSPDPPSPHLGVLGGRLASLAEDFGGSGLGEGETPPGPPPSPPCDPPAPPVRGGLRQLRQVLGVVAQLGVTEGEVTSLGGPQIQAMESQLRPLWQRFETPPLSKEPPQE